MPPHVRPRLRRLLRHAEPVAIGDLAAAAIGPRSVLPIPLEQAQSLGAGQRVLDHADADGQRPGQLAMRRLGIDDKQLTPRTVLARISWTKNHMLDPQEVYLQSTDPNAERVAHGRLRG